MNKTIAKIKQVNSSPAFLIATIAFTLAIVVNALSVSGMANSLQQTVQAVMASQSLAQAADSHLMPVLQSIEPYFYLTLAFSLLVAIGMWMHFFANKSAGEQVSCAGLSLIRLVKVLEIIATVVAWLLMGFVVVFTVMVGYTGIQEAAPDTDMTVFYVVLAVCAAVYLVVLGFVVLYYRGILRTMKSVRMTLSTGVIMGKVSGYVIIANYIIALFTLIGAILSPQLLGLVGGLLQTVSLVFSSIAMSKLRSEMRYIAIRGGEKVQ